MSAPFSCSRLMRRLSHQTRIAPLIAVARKMARLLPIARSSTLSTPFVKDCSNAAR